MSDLAPLHPISRQHLEAMTDGVGILQHAVGSTPDPAHGYCVDDVARALEVDLLHARRLGWAAVSPTAERSLRYLADAFDPSLGRFRNFRSIDGAWIGGIGSDDSYGRAMLALGEAIGAGPERRFVDEAARLFLAALPAAAAVTSPRAEAAVILGCAAALTADRRSRPTAAILELLAVRLHERFRTRGTVAWPWPEDAVTYENALLPRALIVAGRPLADDRMVQTGLATLDWLIDAQTAPAGHLSPIGNAWWPRDGEMAQFDQQPIEATALLLAAEAALVASGDPRYRAAMERSYGWFLGANDLGIEMADPVRGASCDGLEREGANVNEGAESTLMWLMASEHIRAVRGAGDEAARPTELLAMAAS